MAAKPEPAFSAATHAGSPPLPRAWHVTLANGLGETVVAHDCSALVNGILSFHNLPSIHDCVLVRAFALGEWQDVTLIDTPFSPPVHLHPRGVF